MSETSPEQPPEDELTPEELAGWGEFCCWTMLVLTPIIWWLQGPSVSTDQFVVRTSLVVLSAVGGIALRIRALSRRKGLAGTPLPASSTTTSSDSPAETGQP